VPLRAADVPYFTIEQREGLQQLLEARATALRELIAAALRASGGGAQAEGLANHLEEIDDAPVADLESAIEIAALEREVRELRAVEAARQRLHEPGFGVCQDCAAEIPYARLSASPTATRCLHCQTLHERGALLTPRL
jgi:phage/conjugal plasmid C-4 type zinc finger TraR family protein